MTTIVDGTNGVSTPFVTSTGSVAYTSGQTYAGSLTQGTAQTVSTVTSINFTSIPSWVKRITVTMSGVTVTANASNLTLRIGSGAYDATGYNGGFFRLASGNNYPGFVGSTTAFIIINPGTSNVCSGSFVLTNITGNNWALLSSVSDSAQTLNINAGNHTTSGVLNQLQLICADGSTTITGTFNILYE